MFSSGGSGTSHHLSGVLFGQLTGTKLVHVPYKGAPQGVLAVMTGEVTMGFFNTPTVISQIRGGKVKALGVTSLARSPLLPDVPTLDELGVRGYEVNTWFGFVAPVGTPAAVVRRFNEEINKALKAPEVIERLRRAYAFPEGGSPEEFAKFLSEEGTRWTKLVEDANIKIE